MVSAVIDPPARQHANHGDRELPADLAAVVSLAARQRPQAARANRDHLVFPTQNRSNSVPRAAKANPKSSSAKAEKKVKASRTTLRRPSENGQN